VQVLFFQKATVILLKEKTGNLGIKENKQSPRLWNLGTFQRRELDFQNQREGIAKKKQYAFPPPWISYLELPYLKCESRTSRIFRSNFRESTR